MPIMIGKGSVILNNRRVLDGEYRLVRGGQPPAWSGSIEVTGHSRDSLTEIFRWFEAAPAGLKFAAENGGTLPVSRLKPEDFDLESGQARFAIVFGPGLKE